MDFDRRRFLKYSVIGLGIGFLATAITKSSSVATFILKKIYAKPSRNTNLLTPNDNFYTVSYTSIPGMDINSWSLSVAGFVGKGLNLRYSDILKRPYIEKAVTLECIENEIGGDKMSNALWRGIPLSSLLREAEAEDRVYKVVFKGADGYSDSITYYYAMNNDVMLAYKMNGMDLPMEHGYPLRAIVPGIYGMKNVKWLREIELTDNNYLGYWQTRGWSDNAHVNIQSRIDDPGYFQTIRDNNYTIKGIAFAGDEGISKVEVSTDGGRSWNEALIEETISQYAWIKWRYIWNIPKSGEYSMVVRATDMKGRLQTAEESNSYPNGTTGLHTIFVDVV
ncbi:MAG: molybdopterin-dependent oxidoreductase [Nitrospirae bacterium]|nr:molybdopterin-dependent oxidoreductase [Nitrospirota bacterium]